MTKIIGFVFITCVVVAGAGLWYWKANKKRIIRDKLEKTITQKTGGLYQINYKDLNLDELNGQLRIDSFRLTYDSSKYDEMKLQDKQPYLLFNISIPEIFVDGVKTDRALLHNQITGRRLVLRKPVIEILYTNVGKDSSRNIPRNEIYRQILGDLNFIKLDTVTIEGADIITKSRKTGRISVHFFNTTINLFDVAVDSASNEDPTRLLFAKQLDVACEKFTWESRNRLYHYEAQSIDFHSSVSDVTIKHFFVQPKLNELDFINRFRTQTDRFDFAINNIQLRNTDFKQLLDESIVADSLLIGSASFKIYRDRNRPPGTRSAFGNYPHQIIQNAPVMLDIKNGIVKNVFIEYKERSQFTQQTGKVQFWNSSAYISNITNRKETIATNDVMTFDMRSSFLNKVPIVAKWSFYLGNPSGKFSIRGEMGGSDVAPLNALTVPMGPLELTSGHINSLSFDFNGDNYNMNGTLKLSYDDLHIALLKKDDDSIHFKRKKVTSLLANMKVKNSNPEKGKQPRVARVSYKRDIHTSIFNLAWKSLFSGVQEITGAK